MMNTLQLDLHDYKNCFNNAKIPLAYQLVKENRNDRKFESDDLRSKTEKVNVLSLNMDFDKKINQKISLYYRAEGVYNYVKSTGESKDISSGKLQTVATRYLDNAIKLG